MASLPMVGHHEVEALLGADDSVDTIQVLEQYNASPPQSTVYSPVPLVDESASLPVLDPQDIDGILLGPVSDSVSTIKVLDPSNSAHLPHEVDAAVASSSQPPQLVSPPLSPAPMVPLPLSPLPVLLPPQVASEAQVQDLGNDEAAVVSLPLPMPLPMPLQPPPQVVMAQVQVAHSLQERLNNVNLDGYVLRHFSWNFSINTE